MKPTYRKSWAGNLVTWSDLTLGPSFTVKRGPPNLKVLITCLLLVLTVYNVKPTYRKSWAGNLLIWSGLTLDQSFKVKRVQPILKMVITRLLLILEICNVEPTCRISWPGNLLMLSHLTFGPSFKVNGSLALVSCLRGGYRFASVLQFVGVYKDIFTKFARNVNGYENMSVKNLASF